MEHSPSGSTPVPRLVPSPSPSPVRIFDLLPNETLSSIVESLSPFDFNSDEYHFRQDTLRSLCLTSKHLQAIATPFLYRTVLFDSTQKAEQFPQNNTELHDRVKNLTLRLSSDPGDSLVDKVQKVFKKLESLVGNDIAPETITPFLDLKRLHLYEVDFGVGTTFSFPLLEELSLSYVNFEIMDWIQAPKTTFSLPSLRHLAISGGGEYRTPPEGWKELVASVFHHLVSISFEAGNFYKIPELKRSNLSKGPYLVMDFEKYKAMLPHNVGALVHGVRFQLHPDAKSFNRQLLVDFREMLEKQDQSNLSLDALYFPVHLSPVPTSESRREARKLIEAGRKLDVETTFMERPLKHAEDGFISREVVRRSEERWKRIKAEEEQSREEE